MALSLHAAMTVLLCVLVAIVWAASGGGEFWPMWVWFGLAILLAIHALAFSSGRASGTASSGGSESSPAPVRPRSTPRRASCGGSSATSTTARRRAWCR
jgi:hypothetical protein